MKYQKDTQQFLIYFLQFLKYLHVIYNLNKQQFYYILTIYFRPYALVIDLRHNLINPSIRVNEKLSNQSG